MIALNRLEPFIFIGWEVFSRKEVPFQLQFDQDSRIHLGLGVTGLTSRGYRSNRWARARSATTARSVRPPIETGRTGWSSLIGIATFGLQYVPIKIKMLEDSILNKRNVFQIKTYFKHKKRVSIKI